MSDRSPHHHPDAELLLDYAAGKTTEAMSVLVATHLALCPACRAEVRRYEALGGALIESETPVAVAEDALAAVLARLTDDRDDEGPAVVGPTALTVESDPETRMLIPRPLRDYLGGGLNALTWRARGIGIREASLEIGPGGVRTSLIRIAPGRAVPSHTHDGVETTMVLKGAFNDATGRYARGDVATGTEELDHTPVAEPGEECICFIVVDGSLHLTGRFGRLLNPFIRA